MYLVTFHIIHLWVYFVGGVMAFMKFSLGWCYCITAWCFHVDYCYSMTVMGWIRWIMKLLGRVILTDRGNIYWLKACKHVVLTYTASSHFPYCSQWLNCELNRVWHWSELWQPHFLCILYIQLSLGEYFISELWVYVSVNCLAPVLWFTLLLHSYESVILVGLSELLCACWSLLLHMS